MDGTRFRLVDLVSGRCSKEWSPHPNKSPAQFAIVYHQPPSADKVCGCSVPVIISGHADGSVIAYWVTGGVYSRVVELTVHA